MTRVRVATANLLSGRSPEDGVIDAARLSAAIAQLDADVLAVQEVDRGLPRSGAADQLALVAAAMRAVTGRFVPTVAGTPGEPGWTPATGCGEAWPPGSLDPVPPGLASTEPPVGGAGASAPGPAQYGIGLLSRLPVAEWHVLRLGSAPGRYPLVIPSRPRRVLWLPDEPRAAVAAVFKEPRLTVAGTHLSFVPGFNAAQLRRLRRWLARLPGPTLLLGDLNLPGGPVRRVTGWTPLVSAPTFPSPSPRVQLDHALAAGLPLGTRSSGRVIWLPISDHRAVRIDLDLP